jgi:hypothetical protein
MQEGMFGILLDPEHIAKVQLAPSNHSVYFNLTRLFPTKAVTAASHSNPKLIMAASISQEIMTLTLVFKPSEGHIHPPLFSHDLMP